MENEKEILRHQQHKKTIAVIRDNTFFNTLVHVRFAHSCVDAQLMMSSLKSSSCVHSHSCNWKTKSCKLFSSSGGKVLWLQQLSSYVADGVRFLFHFPYFYRVPVLLLGLCSFLCSLSKRVKPFILIGQKLDDKESSFSIEQESLDFLNSHEWAKRTIKVKIFVTYFEAHFSMQQK